MKSMMLFIFFILAMPVIASNHISNEQQSSLKELYHQINVAKSPYTNKNISQEVSRIVNGGCYSSALHSLKRKKHLSFERKEVMKNVMRSTCKCVATENEMVDGIIKSALLFKEHGKHSSLAKNAMRNGIKQAKQKCFSKIHQQITSHRD